MANKHDVRVCPYCGSYSVKIQDTQMRPYVPWLYRRRVCKDCGMGYSTYEIHCKEFGRIRDVIEELEDEIRILKNYSDVYSDIDGFDPDIFEESGIGRVNARESEELAKSVAEEMD